MIYMELFIKIKSVLNRVIILNETKNDAVKIDV